MRRLLLGSVGDSSFGEGIVLLLVVVLLRTVVEGCDDDAFVVVLALSLVRTRLDADPGIDDDDGPDFFCRCFGCVVTIDTTTLSQSFRFFNTLVRSNFRFIRTGLLCCGCCCPLFLNCAHEKLLSLLWSSTMLLLFQISTMMMCCTNRITDGEGVTRR